MQTIWSSGCFSQKIHTALKNLTTLGPYADAKISAYDGSMSNHPQNAISHKLGLQAGNRSQQP